MTPNELKKEAQALWEYLRDQVMLYQQLGSEKNRTNGIDSISEALRAVHDAGRAEAYPNVHEIGDAEVYKRGFNEAIEKAASIADDHNGCVDVKCLSESNCGATAANQIRALKIGDGK